MNTTQTSNDNNAACDYFALEGTIDAQSEGLLMAIPAKVKHPVVRFDFSNAGRVNSMGVALLLRCFKEVGGKAEIRLEGLSQMHSMLFKMTGVFLLATPVDHKKGAA